jgi:hypothetical protein
VQRPHLQVAVDGLGGLRAERYDPWARALAGDVGQLPVQVDVGERKAAQLRHPHFGVEQQPQHDLVAAAEEDSAVEDAGPAAGDRASLEQGGDLVLGEDRDGLLRWRGDLDAVGGGLLQFSFSHQPAAEPAHPAQPGADGAGLGGLGELGQPGADRVPGQLVQRRRPAVLGQPAAEVADGLLSGE